MAGPTSATGTSRTQLAPRNLRIRAGRTSLLHRTVPSASMAMARMACRVAIVVIEDVRSSTASMPVASIPIRRCRCETATATPARTHSPPARSTLRYVSAVGTLAPLWQRQNDANFALAARRRTTAASPTRAGAERFLDPSAVPGDLTTSVYRVRALKSSGPTERRIPDGQSPS